MLLLWLSIVCMIPFDLSRFDSQTNDKNKEIMNRIMNLITPYLHANDKCQDAAAYLLAKFVSRVDVCTKILPKFYETLLETSLAAKSILYILFIDCRALIKPYIPQKAESTLNCWVLSNAFRRS